MKLKKSGFRIYLIIAAMVIVVIAAILYIVQSYIVQSKTNSIISELTLSQAQTANHMLTSDIQDLQSQALERAKIIADSEFVVGDLKNRNYETLKETLINLGEGMDFASICDPYGIVLIRTYTDRFGDDISKYKAVSTVLQTGGSSCSIEEISNIGLSVYASAAVYDGDNLIGVVNCNFDLTKNEYLDNFKEKTGCEASIFLGDKRINTTVKDEYDNRVLGTAADGKVVETVIVGKSEYTGSLDLFGKTHKMCFSPLIVDGQVIGMLSAGVNIVSALESQDNINFWIALISILGITATGSLIVVLSKFRQKFSGTLEELSVKEKSLGILESVLNGMDIFIYVTDPETGEILFINNALNGHFGLTENVIGEPCWKIFQQDHYKRCGYCPLSKLLNNPVEPVVWEDYNTITGRYYRNIDRIIDWPGGEKVHFCQRIDINEMRQAQDMLSNMSSIVQNSPNFIAYKKLTGECIFVNTAASLLTGYTREELMEDYLDILLDEESAGHFRKEIPSALIEKGILDYEVPIKRKDGKIRIFSVCSFLVESEEKAFATVATDITDIKQAQEKLLQMSSIVQSSPNLISYVSKRKCVYISPATSAVTGYSQDELIEKYLDILFDDAAAGYIRNEIIPVIYKDGKADYEIPIKLKNGETRIYSVSSFLVEEDEDAVASIATDITEKKQIEAEKADALQRAEQASRAKNEFLSRMSHEMRTPMNAIIGMAGVAKGSEDLKKMDYCLDKIDIASKHLLGLINDILDMSKIESGKFDLFYSEFNFEKMLTEAVGIVNFRADEKKQNLIINLDKNVPAVIISDERRLCQVITNLLTNAIKFTPDGGNITLNVNITDKSDDVYTILTEVEDNGIGISEDSFSRLFQSFEQADGSVSRKYGGSGLGLAINRQIIEQMGGKIWVESEPGHGSKFSFTIPAKKGEVQSQSVLSDNIQKEELRILAVDDSPETREYFINIMHAFGISCDAAEDGPAALSMIEAGKSRPYNIIFVDYYMPVMNGIDLTRKIMEITGNSAVIIMISGAAWSDIEKDAVSAGVSRFIPKPLFPSALIDALNEYVIKTSAQVNESEDTNGCDEQVDSICQFTGDKPLLLAEDIEINRIIAEEILSDMGLNVECAENGQQALDMYKAQPGKYKLILMDINMPEMDGYTATRLIRAINIPEAANIPIIAMTANVFQEDIEKCLEAGMNDHIGKPVDINELMDKLNKYIR